MHIRLRIRSGSSSFAFPNPTTSPTTEGRVRRRIAAHRPSPGWAIAAFVVTEALRSTLPHAEPSAPPATTATTASATTTAPVAGAAAAQQAAERLPLDEVIRRALARNPSVSVALAEIDRADALVREARAGWFPILSANGSYLRLDHDRVSNGAVLAPESQWNGNLQLTVPLVAAPAWTNTRHAKDNRHVAELNADDVRREIAQTAARAYLTVVAEHRLLAASETARSNAKAHYDYAHTRLAGGLGRSIDEVRAAQDLATVEAQLQATLVALARAREALGVLVAAPAPIEVFDDVTLPAPPSPASASEEARTRRADVRVLQARLQASERAADDIWAYYAPYLSAVAQPFLQHPATLLEPTHGWQVQLLLTLPLYDGGTRSGIARERDALVVEANASLEATLRQAQSEVRVGFEAMLRADEALGSARNAARLAARAYELATLAYRAGASTNIEVIDAARQQRDADTAAAQAEDQARQARLDLLVATGRFP